MKFTAYGDQCTGEPGELDTPYLVVDVDALEANLRAMAAWTQARGMDLRPHAKTHKCLEVARRQLAFGAVGLTVATVGEAEVFAADGCDDIFIAYPIWASGRRGRRLRELAGQIRLCVGVDSADSTELLGETLRGTDATVLVEVDSGHHRCGVRPERAGEIAVAAVRAGLDVAGVFTFPGHSYGPGAPAPAASDESVALLAAVESLNREGIEVRVRSGGSTPSAALTRSPEVTELRPGVYVFNDAQQVELGTCAWSDVALTAAATVVSRSGRTMILDAGSKVLGADRPAWTTGSGRLPDRPDARITALSEHHATVLLGPDDAVPELGEVLRVAPNHVCNAVNLAAELVVGSGGRIVDRWAVAARDQNS